MNDPAGGVPPALLPHIQLVSTHRFPQHAQMHLETIVDLLLQAPKITREVAAMNWQFVDAPQDGTIMLIWQPPQMGTVSATDGFVYAGSEAAFCSEVRGYTVEMYYHRCGFHPPHETVATHARKRYRIAHTPKLNPNVSPADPSLWIIHYSRTEPQHQLPANRIPIIPQVQTAMTQRKYLQQHGQLVRKEFMLHDRNNWPTINLPNSNIPQPWNPASNYPNNVMSHMGRSHPSYIMQQQAANQAAMSHPPAAKRPRQVGPSHAHGQGRSQGVLSPLEDDEDTANGDIMDTLTPREISAQRYIQHHEWMEEIFSSPYETNQIVPVELGLGRKGEIESLTRDFFDTPTNVEPNIVKGAVPPRVGRLEDGKADDFTAKATQKVAQLNAEMEKLKKQHAKRIAKLNRGNALKQAEQHLRNPIPGKHGIDGNADHADGVFEAIEKVQGLLGESIKVIKDVECVQKGGLEEKSQAYEGDHQNFDLDQSMQDFHPDEAQPTPHQSRQAPSDREYASTGHTPQTYSQPPIAGDGVQDLEPVQGTSDADVAMTEIPTEALLKDGETGDWIVVDEEGEARSEENQETPAIGGLSNNAASEGGYETPGHELDTAGDALQDFAPDQGVTVGFNPDDFHDTVDFGSLDTAGEGLGGFVEGTNAEIGLDEHGDLGLDDSAFGEAFHAPESGEQQETGGTEP